MYVMSSCVGTHTCTSMHISFHVHARVINVYPMLVPFDVTVLIWLKLPFIVQGIVEIKHIRVRYHLCMVAEQF